MAEKVTHKYKGKEITLKYLDRDQIAQMKKKGGYMEHNMLKFIEKLGISDIYVDIGAHIGNHVVFFAEYCKCEKVIAYEAIPEIYEVLVENASYLNDKVELINTAVSTSSHYNPVYKEEKPGCSTIRMASGGLECKFEIPSKKVGLVKIDVECGELDVIMTCMELIERDSPHLFIESFKGFEWILEVLPNEYEYIRTFNNAPTHYFRIKK